MYDRISYKSDKLLLVFFIILVLSINTTLAENLSPIRYQQATQVEHTDIMKIQTMKDAQTEVENLLKIYKPEEILVAFDIDMTLTQPDHPAVYYPAIKKYVDVYKAVLGQLSPEQKDLASTLTTQIVPQRWVEKTTPQIVKDIQNTGVKVIALTAILAGEIQDFPEKMVVLRQDQLQKMGFDFTKSFKDFVSVKEFFEFKKYAGAYPIFYHGILSTNGEGGASKGDVLVAFLQHIGPHDEGKARNPGFYPRVILVIDDKKKHLEDVEKKIKAYAPFIKVIEVGYEGAYTYAPEDISKEDFRQFWERVADRTKNLQ